MSNDAAWFNETFNRIRTEVQKAIVGQHDVVEGVLVGLASDRVSIQRSDPRVGDVVVHFPRAGFVVVPL